MKMHLVRQITHYCHIKPKGCSKIHSQTIDFYDLTFVLDGSMVYISDGKRIVLQKNDAIFLPPQTVRSREKSQTFVEYASFNFKAEDRVSFLFEPHVIKCININIKRLLSLYSEAHISDGPYSMAKCECLLNFILLEMHDGALRNSCNLHVTKIKEYINAHETEKISLQDISQFVHLAKEYCSCIFKEQTGQTLIQYINDRKILLAKSLLIKKEMSHGDICEYLNFNNYNYFSRLFKKHTGICPSKFAREWRE